MDDVVGTPLKDKVPLFSGAFRLFEGIALIGIILGLVGLASALFGESVPFKGVYVGFELRFPNQFTDGNPALLGGSGYLQIEGGIPAGIAARQAVLLVVAFAGFYVLMWQTRSIVDDVLNGEPVISVLARRMGRMALAVVVVAVVVYTTRLSGTRWVFDNYRFSRLSDRASPDLLEVALLGLASVLALLGSFFQTQRPVAAAPVEEPPESA